MRPSSSLHLAAFLWGLAEATLFFIVPDILLSAAALSRLRAALVACAWTTTGALVGGAVMYAWGATAPTEAWAVLDRVPAIGLTMQENVRKTMAEHSLAVLFLGPLTGTPYKLYAVAAGQQGLAPAAFLLVSLPARALRFVLVSLLAYVASRRLSEPWRLPVLAACWLAFYFGYFIHMGW